MFRLFIYREHTKNNNTMSQKRTFTSEEENTIKALYEEGIGIKTIAKGLHCHPDKVSLFVRSKYGPNSMQDGVKKNPTPNPDRDIHLSVNMALAIATADDKEVGNTPVLRIGKAPKAGLKPPVGNEWKPWMIPTDIIIPEDTSALNWSEYAKDYDRRKRICDERNAKLKG